MEELNFPGTKNTPEIVYDRANSRYTVIGISIPENANAFYGPVIERTAKVLPDMADGTVFHFRLPYFNSSSLKALYMLLSEVKKALENGKSFIIEWCVEEDDEFMTEAAETFSEMLGVPLTVITIDP